MCFILTVLPIANNASSYFTPFGARDGIVGIYRTLNRRPHILTFNLEKHRLYLKHGFHRGRGDVQSIDRLARAVLYTKAHRCIVRPTTAGDGGTG